MRNAASRHNTNRRSYGIGHQTTKPRRQLLSRPTTVGTKKDIGGRFIDHFGDWDAADLAKGAKVTKEAARLWLNGERTIDLKSALELATSTKEGKFWLMSELGEFDSSRLIHELLKSQVRGKD